MSIQSKTSELLVQAELGTAYGFAGNQRAAIEAFRQASILLTDLGYGDSNTAVALLNNWALTLVMAGRPLEAEKVYRQAVDLTQANAQVQPMLLINYADALRELARLPEAESYADRGYEKVQELKDQNVLKNAVAEQLRIYREQYYYPRAVSRSMN